ncbi:MAG: phosphotransferase, partial [Armatimonadota bacterium]|nr:phosphotransferase [Armatimonadota bacterium]
SVPMTGTVNRTVLAQTENGAYAFRSYLRPDRARVEWEHKIIARADTGGIPVCRPLPLPDGGTFVERGGHFYALFPLATGQQISRDNLGMSEVAAAGRCLARIHRRLADFPAEQARPKLLAFDTAETLALIPRLEAAIRAQETLTELDQAALLQLAGRRQWLEQATGDDALMRLRLAGLPQQVVHGDFQETNLFFAGNEVSAVIDWDQSGLAARAWEVMRALDLMLRLAPEPCRVFLSAYRNVYALPDEELDEAAACYGVLADRNLWVYEAVYLDGNERVRQFLAPDGFVPFSTRWRILG